MVIWNLKEMENTLNKIHPKQIVNNANNTVISMFKVNYEYKTNRNNKRNGEKVFILNTYNPQTDLTEHLNKWVEDFNNENSHRQISNVKLLGSQCIGYINI